MSLENCGNEETARRILENRQAYAPMLVQVALKWRLAHPDTARRSCERVPVQGPEPESVQ